MSELGWIVALVLYAIGVVTLLRAGVYTNEDLATGRYKPSSRYVHLAIAIFWPISMLLQANDDADK